MSTRKHLDHTVLTVVSAGEKGTKRMTVRLVDVQVASYQQPSGDSNGFPIDVVDLEYGWVIYSVYPQQPAGSSGTPIVSTFDLRSQRAGSASQSEGLGPPSAQPVNLAARRPPDDPAGPVE